MRKWVLRIVFVSGFLLLCYPLVGNYIQRQHQERAVADYQTGVDTGSEEERQAEISKANEYNDMLFQSHGAIVDNLDTSILSEESYQSLLDVSGTGVMGSIEIPKIDVDLPIYHGTSDEVLDLGVGHLEGSSLPIGGESTKSILTGHRGLPGSSLFTRLDEMEEGDLFFLDVMGETLAYKVCDIVTILPEDVESLEIEAGADKVSLITCTPYGINTHRLVVTGERVPYEEAEYNNIMSELPSIRELAFMILPFALLGMVIIIKIVDWRKSKHEKQEKS